MVSSGAGRGCVRQRSRCQSIGALGVLRVSHDGFLRGFCAAQPQSEAVTYHRPAQSSHSEYPIVLLFTFPFLPTSSPAS